MKLDRKLGRSLVVVLLVLAASASVQAQGSSHVSAALARYQEAKRHGFVQAREVPLEEIQKVPAGSFVRWKDQWRLVVGNPGHMLRLESLSGGAPDDVDNIIFQFTKAAKIIDVVLPDDSRWCDVARLYHGIG